MATPLLNPTLALSTANAGGLGFGAGALSGAGASGGSSLGAYFGGGIGAGAASNLSFSTALLEQLVAPQHTAGASGQISQAQLDAFRSELPPGSRAQWDALLNQLALQDLKVEAPKSSYIPEAQVPEPKVITQPLAPKNPVLPLMQQWAEQEPLLVDVRQTSEVAERNSLLNAATNKDSDVQPKTLLETVLPKEAESGRVLPTLTRPVEAEQELASEALLQAQKAVEVDIQVAQPVERPAPQAHIPAQSAITELQARVVEPRPQPKAEAPQPSVQPNHATSSTLLGLQEVDDVLMEGFSRANVNHSANAAETPAAERGLTTAASARDPFESLMLPTTAQPKQSITQGFETLTFVNELGVEHVQRPAGNDGAPQVAEFARGMVHQSPADQVAVQIRQQAHLGMQQIQIQLEPADLGRVEIQLEMASDGKVQAMVSADNQDTLDLLQRDSKALEEALAQAGLEADASQMEFSLSKHDHEGDALGGEGHVASSLQGNEEDIASVDELIAHYHVNVQQGLDIRV